MQNRPFKLEYDAIRPDGRVIAEIKYSVDALRTVRTAIMNLAYALEKHPVASAYLVLVAPTITKDRVRHEWRRAEAILKPRVFTRLAICLLTTEGVFHGVPANPPADVQDWLSDIVERQAANLPIRAERTDYEFVIMKVLIHQWLTERKPVTMAWLARTAGCSYPTVSRVLQRQGSMIERTSDRRVALRFFPQKEFSRLLAKSERARSTTRFLDQSGQPRTPKAHLRRLEKIRPEGIAIGGALGAMHYLPSLDLVGTPRLDLSIHCHNAYLDVGLIKALDPALKREDDPFKPANVVVHAIRHADPLFSARKGGLAWADPVECLLDLQEARLEAQANQLLEVLKSRHGSLK